MDCAVHLASLAELFFNSVARMAPLCQKGKKPKANRQRKRGKRVRSFVASD